MSNFVAVIKSLVGQVFVVSLDGLKRQVFEGERMFQGDQVVTASGGSATLELANGDVIDIAANGNWQAGGNQASESAQAAPEPASELEQAIAAGFDPTADLEPTAAGPGAAGGAGGAAGGGHSFVMLDETGQQLDPTVGFETQGLAFAFDNLDEEVAAIIDEGPVERSAPTIYAEISVNAASVAEGGSLTYTVTLKDSAGNLVSVPTGSTVSVALNWSGAAAGGADTSALPSSVSIAGGSSSATFDVSANDDYLNEGSEPLVATISGVTDSNSLFEAVAIGSNNVANSAITDDAGPSNPPGTPGPEDTVYAEISVNAASVAEGGSLTYTVTLKDSAGSPVNVPTGSTVSVALNWSGAAAGGADTSVLLSSVNIVGGSSSATFDVSATDDFLNEGSEPLVATISSVTDSNSLFEAVAIGTNNAATSAITDDAGPSNPPGTAGPEDTVYAVIEGPTTVAEGATTGAYTVKLVDQAGNSVTVTSATNVTVQFANGTAEAGDYAAADQTVTIAAGSSSATLTVATNEDVDFDNETFTASIKAVQDNGEFEAINISSGAAGQTASATTTIVDNDVAPTISINDVTVNEDAGTATFTVTLGNATTAPVTFNYATSNGTATAGTDYTATTDSGSIAAGATTATFTVAIADDFIKEGNETFNVTLSGLSTNVAASGNDLLGVGTITDTGSTPPTETITAADTVYAVIEGPTTVAEGATTGAYTVKLVDQAGNSVTVTSATNVTVQFANGTAEAGDYAAADQTVTIAAGSSSATLTVATNEDVDFDNETFTASIKAVQDNGEFEAINISSGAAGQTASATTTIVDNDVAPTISINDVTVNEDAGTATFTVTLGNATTAPVTFNYATSNGTATAGTDYTATTGSGSIAAGATTATFTVAIADDFIKEGNETFNVTLSGLSTNVAASGNDLLGVGTITDTGSTPPTETITAADTVYAVIEGPTTVAEGATTGAYTVKLVDQAGNSVTVTSATNVTVQFANGTAEAGDYAAADQTVTIAAGSSSATLTVATNEDVDFDNETFTASIKAVQDNGEFEAINISSGAAGQTASATTTIVDNDVAPTISINDVTVNEDAGTATFTVTLGNATTAPVTFNYATSNGTATAGTDYTATTGSGSIAAGATTATFTVAIADDFIKEGNETFNVTLSGLSTNVAASGNDLLGVGTITDTGSTPPTETITAADTVYAVIEGPTTVAEGATTGAYTVKLVDQAGNSVTVTSATNVTVQFANGTAEAGDYAAADQTVTIAAGSSSATLTVATNEDVDFDNETFTASIKAVQDNGEFEAINISSGAAGQTASATTTIVDNDVAPTISINDVTVNEDAGTATFTVTLGNATTAPVTFNYATSNGTATAGTDYTATTDSGSIAAGATTATFTVAIADDFIKEGNETFNVTLSGLSTNVAASGNDLLGVGTITDTGSTPPTETITAADTVYAVIEGPTTVAEGATTGAYTVKLVDQAGNSVTVTSATNVTVQFANGTAEAGDYAAADQTVTIAAGSSSATLTVATNEDVDFDNETFTASIKAVQDNGEFEAINISSGAAGQTASATTTIVDNDVAPTISINDVTVNEDAGTATFTVTLGNATTAPVTFNYATSNGTATAGTDYTATTDSGSIAAGATTATFTVAIADDFIKEGNETFNVTLSGLSTNVAASGNDLLGVGTITDTGSTPPTETITAADTVYAVIEGPTTVAEGATTGAYTVKLVDQAGNSVTVTSATNVTVQFANGTAEAGDYAAADQTVTIAAGSSSATLTVATNEDVDFDNETFTASIKAVQDNGEFEAINISSGAAGQTASATTTIVDNDVAPTISINDVTVNEDAGTATFTVTLGNATTAPVTFNYATSNGTATAGTDYTATTGSGSIAAGATTATFTVAIADDFIKEGNETFNVTLSGLSTNVAASGNDLLGVGTITDTGSTPPTETITAADTVYAVIEGPTTVAEGATTGAYTVKLVDQAGNSVTVTSATNVTVQFANGTAEAGDYAAADQTVTIAAGSSSATLTVATNEDVDFDNETFTASIKAVQDNGEFEAINISSGAAGQTASATTTIVDNDVAPTISINDVTVNEDAGTATFTVTLGNATTAPVTFNYATSNGTATAGTDYTATTDSGSIAAGATTATFTVAIADDFIKEGNETFNVTLSGLSTNVAASGNDLLGVGTITDTGSTPPTETITAADTVYAVIEGPTTVAEGATTGAYTVKLVDQAGNSVTVTSATNVTVQFANGTAEAGDYAAADQTVTIAAGSSSATLTVATNEDVDFDNETFTASIKAVQDNGEFEAINISSGAAGQTASATTTIVDNDVAPTISINDVTVNEDAGTATFTVTLGNATTAPVTFNYATSNGTATAGTDYTATTDSGSIAAGATTATFTVAIADDFIKEGNETFNVTLSGLSTNVAASGNDLLGVGTITDTGSTPPTETITAADTVYAVIEGPTTVAEGATTGAYTVKLVDQAGNSVTVTSATNVTVQFANGTAEAGDYAAADQTVTIAAGSSSATLTVATNEDVDFDNETFTASIKAVQDNGEFEAINISSGAAGQTASATTTIVDNDVAPTISINDVTVNEDAGTATFTVTLGNATTAPVTFNYATSNGTATAGTDYTATTGSGSIAAGATTATFTVAIADDFIKEGNETFNVTLSGLSTNVAASGNDLLGVGTITDTGSTPPTETITAADTVYAVIEGPTTVAEGATTGAYTVKLVDQAGNSVTVTSATNVTVQFANGTAEAGDYAAADQTVTIAAGSSSATLTVATNEDVDFDNETFTASIKAVQDNGEFEAINISSGAAGQTASATTTIVDNDVAPTISINDVTVNEDAGTATFTVTLGNATTAPVTFNYATSNGTATAGTDYTATTGSGSIAAGATTATFTVAIADDFIKEGNETFNVTLSGLSTNVAASGNDLLGVGTITDTGSTPPTETITAADTVYAVIEGPTTVAEGATTGAYTVKLVDQAGNSVTVTSATNVTVQFANGTAEAGDYAAADQTVTIAAGSSSATLTVATNEDVDFDNETFTASIKAVQDNGEFEAINISSGAAGQTASATTTIVDNDVAPTISINDVTVNEDAGTATFTVTLGNATTAPVTFNYATSNGTATAGTDYTATTGSGSIAAGATTATFTVAIADDFIKEGNETFNVTLSGLSTNVAASGNDLLGVGTITDTGSTPPTETITAADTVYAVIEGPTTVAEGATTGAYTVKLVDQAGNSVTVTSATNVTVQFANGTAEAGDYAAADQTVTIAAGSSSATLTVATNEDVDFDNETFTASIKAVQDNGEFEAINISSGAAGQTASATTTIVDNDVAPTISINDVTVNEDAGTATFTVTLGNATTAPVTFNYATSNGTATAGTDYTATTDSGSIAAGATTATFTVAIADDFIKEGNETFNVTLSGLSTNVAASGNDLLGVGTITDNR
ncbi:Calx-beta domain-containing protein [Pseudomonas paeninsulae]|uniref:Calx-beta domain-containing protein n=1 Tax=Pseudomonas paeninsulae TaxID=3110772 RepID=UPI002D79E2A9|nr:Calx-beta domain-containing protein [Pseudomonas sp. IT1137]